jgi:aromatic-L-amino-acid decarboxylase
MTPDEFRSYGHQLVDWMADYLRDVGQRRVVPQVTPGDIRRSLPSSPPATGEGIRPDLR